MLRTTHSGNFNTRISGLSKQLSGSSKNWSKAAKNLKASSRQTRFAESDFDRADRAASWASRDNGRTDSSRHGDDMDGSFREGNRNLDWAESLVRKSDRQVDTLQEELSTADGDLEQLIKDMRAAGDARVALLQQAATSLDSSEASFATLSPEFREFKDGAREVDGTSRMAQWDIDEVMRDRPGMSVARAARRVQDHIRDIDHELRGLSDNLTTSQEQGEQGRGYLATTISLLDQAVQGL